MEWWPLILGAVVAVASPWLIKFLAAAIAEKVVHDLGDNLQDRWKRDIDKAIEPVDARLHAIEKELTPNGGESLFDKVTRIERLVQPKQFSDPNGTPQGF